MQSSRIFKLFLNWRFTLFEMKIFLEPNENVLIDQYTSYLAQLKFDGHDWILRN